ncbi:hypothetical protein BX281_5546 [Streptomyces sp. Ag82_O1-15]|uniref:hypothetical protein n=1 Tax=Streptomyces sp. Ag82_O1-15 TaxID=1938855 RepID=UPI000BB0CFB3|nr:hypothetical protein [Streptomyces sp. Ag82_O1-15]PBC97518.1 hypothetical protein BX281_5546 [Streptomyces sp. Ag82_O1-15]
MRAHISRSLVSRSGTSRSRGILLPPLVGAAPVPGPVGRADHDAVFHPLLEVLSAVAERGGRLDAAEAAGFTRALETANASVERRLKERASATSATSAASAASATSAAPDRAGVAVADPVTVADPVADLLAQLQSTVDGLVKALTGALGTVTGLLSPVVGVVTGLLGGGLSGLPDLPTAGSPATPSR